MLAIVVPATSMNKNPRRSLQHNCIHVTAMDKDAFYFKSDREMDGAVIDVYSYKTGDKVMSDVIKSKKNVVNMQALESGDYIILITKGEFKRKYVFHRK